MTANTPEHKHNNNTGLTDAENKAINYVVAALFSAVALVVGAQKVLNPQGHSPEAALKNATPTEIYKSASRDLLTLRCSDKSLGGATDERVELHPRKNGTIFVTGNTANKVSESLIKGALAKGQCTFTFNKPAYY